MKKEVLAPISPSTEAPIARDIFKSLQPFKGDKPDDVLLKELGVPKIIGLGSNESCYGGSPKAIAAIQEAALTVHKYPDAAAQDLREALSEYFGLPTDHFVIGNGSNELISLLLQCFVRPGENMIYSHNSFFVYKIAAMLNEIPIRDVPIGSDFRFDLGAILRNINDSTKLIFIANPNNPTGTYVTSTEFEDFLKQVPKETIVVLDEAYIDYATAGDCESGVKLLSKYGSQLIILRTFSKAYGLAGLRVGYLIGHPDVVNVINCARQPFNVNSLALVGAKAALLDQEFLQRTAQLNDRERTRVTNALTKFGFEVVPSQGNFVLVNINRNAEEFCTTLLNKGAIIRSMQGYGLPTYVRISIGTEEENTELLNFIN